MNKVIHIITHSRYVPIRAYFSKSKALKEYEKLREDKNAAGSYTMISLPIQDWEKYD